ncbi:glycoside hydrolase family 3 N-terminal domain-containing protein [Schaalia sp. ZJ405]|uniref:glycoside hydrolase family 3 N-terminal domain-containing protein n=1 Tax=Schaalia sp. ZJ405 TaxID=2709403 RepID=UPI0018C9E839|nr:glycoside hydrolase family 3 N-terminal domain-containing protein [Schaalia sp. ZJ405]
MAAKKAKKQKKRMRNGFYLLLTVPFIVIALVLAIGINVATSSLRGIIVNAVGDGEWSVKKAKDSEELDRTYYQADYKTIDEAMKASGEVTGAIAEEGMVLLKNNGTLPLPGGKVTLYGRGAADPLYGGTGSGHAVADDAVTIRAGLESAGYEVNATVYNELEAFAAAHSEAEGGRTAIAFLPGKESVYKVGEMPVDQYSSDALHSMDEFNDAALVVISRTGGEGGDMLLDMDGHDENYVEGQHLLELNKDERDQVELAKAHSDRVIVLVNASTSIELGDLQNDPDVDAIMMVGNPGVTGFAALGKLLNGELNPSGRTVDTFAADFTKDPTFVNFGDFRLTNVEEGTFVDYEEGIYSGYRYYETAAEEGFINYDEAVVYPFGFGLSYTNFTWEVVNQKLGKVGEEISVDVRVTNTGDVAGKDVVEMYYSAPYVKGGIEKPSVVLADFAKTDVLEPGESQTLTLSIAVDDMASYDYKGAKSYVLEAGEYQLSLRTDSHTVKEGTTPIALTIDHESVFDQTPRSTDQGVASNQFDDVSAAFAGNEALDPEIAEMVGPKKTILSRADFAGTFPSAPTREEMTAGEALAQKYEVYDASAANEGIDAQKPQTNVNNGIQLIDLRGRQWDDPQWEKYLDQFTSSELYDLVNDGAYRTVAIGRLGKPATLDMDGPAGFSSFISDVHGSAFPTGYILGQTWNRELARQMGVSIGNEALALGISGWYAPAVNTHRSPFAGRNFEYYSEDGTLAGKIAASTISGALEKGVYSYLKHFALNDQETNRDVNGLATWADEQTIREVYLKPFSIALKESRGEVKYLDEQNNPQTNLIHGTAVMSSFNRIGMTWAGGNSALLTKVLRDEWGFKGMVVTDMAALRQYMSPDWAIAGGTDLQLAWKFMKPMQDPDSAISLVRQRAAAHNILYAVANSNALNGVAPGDTLQYHRAAWEWIVIGITVVLALLAAFGTYRVVRRCRRYSQLKKATPSGEKIMW